MLEYIENNTVQLFNLKDGIVKENDLSEKEPEKAKELLQFLSLQKNSGAKMM
ncbi:hypothetical protein [Marinifilum caeruleilacunae]|uniref:hypothetical protein n=1 Tax=Marinifilum caeruleilacunae TaxID=2499076 RepID=UPI001491C692|nr:hypothetical protein [Marinifilum caeruleilacunae]